jgi:hypothetical protein
MKQKFENKMDKKTIFKCIEITEAKFRHYYNEAKRVGEFNPVKEQECVRAAIALKDLKDELWEMWQRSQPSI